MSLTHPRGSTPHPPLLGRIGIPADDVRPDRPPFPTTQVKTETETP